MGNKVNVVSAAGELRTIDEADLDYWVNIKHYRKESLPEKTQRFEEESRKRETDNKAAKFQTLGEGLLSSGTLGLGSLALRGIYPDWMRREQRHRHEDLPEYYLAGDVAGTVLSGGLGALASGARIASAVPLAALSRAAAKQGVAATARLGKLAGAVTAAGIEGAAIGGAQEIGQASVFDDELTVGSVAGKFVRGAATGGAIGLAAGAGAHGLSKISKRFKPNMFGGKSAESTELVAKIQDQAALVDEILGASPVAASEREVTRIFRRPSVVGKQAAGEGVAESVESFTAAADDLTRVGKTPSRSAPDDITRVGRAAPGDVTRVGRADTVIDDIGRADTVFDDIGRAAPDDITRVGRATDDTLVDAMGAADDTVVNGLGRAADDTIVDGVSAADDFGRAARSAENTVVGKNPLSSKVSLNNATAKAVTPAEISAARSRFMREVGVKEAETIPRAFKEFGTLNKEQAYKAALAYDDYVSGAIKYAKSTGNDVLAESLSKASEAVRKSYASSLKSAGVKDIDIKKLFAPGLLEGVQLAELATGQDIVPIPKEAETLLKIWAVTNVLRGKSASASLLGRGARMSARFAGGRILSYKAGQAASAAGLEGAGRVGAKAVAYVAGSRGAGKLFDKGIAELTGIGSGATGAVKQTASKILGMGAKVASKPGPRVALSFHTKDAVNEFLFDKPHKESVQEGFARKMKELRFLANDRDSLIKKVHEQTKSLAVVSPQHAEGVKEKMISLVDYLHGKAPMDPMGYQAFGTRPWIPSEHDMAVFGEYLMGATNPEAALERLSDGKLTPQAAEALRTQHPKYVADLEAELLEHPEQLKSIKPAIRVQLSLLFQQPFDVFVSMVAPLQDTYAAEADKQADNAMSAPGGPKPKLPTNTQETDATTGQQLTNKRF